MRFCPLTLTPLRTDHTSDPVVLSSRRATYNTWARAQYGMAQQLVDVGDLLCAGGTYADPRLYVDGLHPNLAGANVLAAGVFAVLRGRGLL
jgi:lysophospholipase L1-like esterase